MKTIVTRISEDVLIVLKNRARNGNTSINNTLRELLEIPVDIKPVGRPVKYDLSKLEIGETVVFARDTENTGITIERNANRLRQDVGKQFRVTHKPRQVLVTRLK